jgi:hypothetical protein
MATLAPALPAVVVDQVDKTRFAEAYLRFNDATKAAMITEPVNVGRSLRIANEWLQDAFVQTEIARLLEDKGDGAFLDSKADILREIKKRADAAKEPRDYVSIMELYCKVAGHIEKPGSNSVQVNVQSVMVVPSQGTDADWERNAKRAQRALIEANND